MQKEDLISIAEFFIVLVSKEAKKQVIKYELYEKLAEVGILPGRSYDAEIEADAPSESKLADSQAVCHVDPTVRLN